MKKNWIYVNTALKSFKNSWSSDIFWQYWNIDWIVGGGEIHWDVVGVGVVVACDPAIGGGDQLMGVFGALVGVEYALKNIYVQFDDSVGFMSIFNFCWKWIQDIQDHLRS